MAGTTYEPLNPWRCSKSIIQTNSDRAGTDAGRCQTAQYHMRPERFLGYHEHDVLGLLSGRKASVR